MPHGGSEKALILPRCPAAAAPVDEAAFLAALAPVFSQSLDQRYVPPIGALVSSAGAKLPIRFGDHSPAVGTFYEERPIMKKKSFEPGRDNIVLIGMPGAGKSTLGIVLAKILLLHGLRRRRSAHPSSPATNRSASPSTLWAPMPSSRLRNQVLSEMSFDHSVIATGGSAIYSEPAMDHLSDIGRVVYLKISFDELKQRLADFSERGVVMRDGIGMSLRDLYDERLPLYEKYADITVDVNDLSITAAARKVAAALK